MRGGHRRRRARVVGERTFGKGVGQSVISLPNGGQLVYLSFEWLTPERRSINEKGITLDRKVLADLAMNNPETFKSLVNSVK